MKKLSAFFLTIFITTLLSAQTDVTFFTTEGRFVVKIYDNIVPITGGNFLTLVNQKFYDGVIFHRVINNFMIQGGDPTGTGSGGPGYSIMDEFDSSLSNVQKTISMANSGPNTGGSQFFINLVDNTFLDFNNPPLSSKHPVFGLVIENFTVVQTIGNVATNGSDRPIIPVVMDSIREGSLLTVGIDQVNSENFTIRSFPNPVEANSILQISMKKSGLAQIQIFNPLGSIVTNNQIELRNGINQLYISDLLATGSAKGIYHINVQIEGSIQSLSIVVQ